MDHTTGSAGHLHVGAAKLDAMLSYRSTSARRERWMIIAQEARSQETRQIVDVREVIDETAQVAGQDGHGGLL